MTYNRFTNEDNSNQVTLTTPAKLITVNGLSHNCALLCWLDRSYTCTFIDQIIRKTVGQWKI